MSKRRLDFLDLPTPTKRPKLRSSEIDQGFSWSKNFGFVRFAPDGTQYKEIPLMLPFALSTVQQDTVRSLPLHNWNNMYLHYSSDALYCASLQAISETVQAITIEDRATARFAGYIGYSRTIPFDYHTLPTSQQWITPVQFSKKESLISIHNSPLYIDYPWIQGSYFPKKYFGIRQSFIIHPDANPFYTIRRGTKVVLGSVIGDGVAYFVTRIRFIHQDTTGVEVIGITDDGSFHDDTSLSWPPIMLEVDSRMVDKSSFRNWVPSINE